MSAVLKCPKCGYRLTEAGNFCPSCGDDVRGLTPTSDTLSGPWVGRVIDGRYRLVEKLGEGGMGAVYKVEHVRMGKVLALKVLRPDLAIDRKMKTRFQQEARVVSRLSHPNTIQVFDFGELEDGSLYIAMEFLAGRDLAWMLRTHGPFSEERAIAIGAQVLASLGEAHRQGIVHRDIKPGNVLLVRNHDGVDTVKVLDFGIAKLNEGEARKHITGITDFVGTPQYMSPEQARGEPLDARSDLYSVGALLFELVAGRPVFEGPNPMAIVTRHLEEPPRWIAEVAPERRVSVAFEQVIRRALAKEPDARFPDAPAMRAALERARRELAGPTFDLTPPHALNEARLASRQDFDRFERRLRMRRAAAPAIALLLLGAAGAGGWLALRGSPPATLAAEREPNDEPLSANRIAMGVPVSGHVGAALSATESDRDVFVVDVPEDGPYAVELAGVADLNLVLDAYQAGAADARSLERVVLLDDGRTGAGERVDALRIRKGALYLRVQEKAHASEPPRPPRESTRLTYALQVRALGADERLESEPANDRVETSSAAPLGRAIRGFGGTPLPESEVASESPHSASDVFRVEAQGAGAVHAVVVPLGLGRLAVSDEHALSSWRRAAGAASRSAAPPFAEARGTAVAIPLQAGAFGHAVRVQPLAGSGGEPYLLAFFADRAGGLDGVVDLALLLEREGRRDLRDRAVEAVRGALKGSPQLPLLDARLGEVLANSTVR